MKRRKKGADDARRPPELSSEEASELQAFSFRRRLLQPRRGTACGEAACGGTARRAGATKKRPIGLHSRGSIVLKRYPPTRASCVRVLSLCSSGADAPPCKFGRAAIRCDVVLETTLAEARGSFAEDPRKRARAKPQKRRRRKLAEGWRKVRRSSPIDVNRRAKRVFTIRHVCMYVCMDVCMYVCKLCMYVGR